MTGARGRFLAVALTFVGSFAAMLPASRAHEALSDTVWHRVRLGLNARHLDVTIELTFFEEWSVRERQRMDADGDGHIQRAELTEYANKLESMVSGKIALLVAGRRVELVPLYTPEVNLLGRHTVERSHHQLTLRFFATIPPELTTGASVVVEDRLWPEARCLAENAVVADAAVIEAGSVTERVFPASENEPLRFTARCVATPAALMRKP